MKTIQSNIINPINLISLGLVSLSLLSSIILASSTVSADDTSVVDQINITVPISCTMSGTGMQSHNAEIANGIYTPDIGSTTLHAFCNDNEGFAIYAAGYTGNEVGGTNSNKLVGTTASGNAVIESGIATTAGNPDVSNWAMKLTATQDSGDTTGTNAFTIDSAPNVALPSQAESGAAQAPFSNYHVVPNEYTKVAHKNSATDMTATTGGVKLTTTYAAYISKTQPADAYSGQVIYTLVHPESAEAPLSPQPSTAGCINYFANASNAVGTMGCQSATDNASITLLASNFSRDGYGFAGWSDAYDYATNSSAHFYGPQETITAPVGTNANGLSLYAVWVKSEGNLQDAAKVTALCGTNGTGGSLTTAPTNGTANLSSVSALTDQRDNQTYAIARLADGNCWMIENLRLDNTASLTLANTNNPLNDGTNVTLKHSYSDTETYNTLSASQDPTATAWCSSNSASCDDQSMLFTGNTNNRASSPTANGVAMYSYGNYYNWYSATAGRGTYSFSTNNNSVAGDLCPTGWHLPKGGRKANVDISEFWKLSRATIGADPANFANDNFYYTGTPEGTDASNKMRAYPNNFVYSGYVGSGSVYDRGSYGYYWSSTAKTSSNAYYLSLSSSRVYPGTDNSSKYIGRTVRCVAPGV